MALRLEEVRRATDVFRHEYLHQIGLLENAYPDQEFDFEPWKAAVLARPRVDAATEMQARNTEARKFGRLFLRNADNEVVDVLAIDAHGNAATARESEALIVFADEWADKEEPPEMEDYLGWVATQIPYGPQSFDAPKVEQGTGSIEEIATRLLSESR
jgi:hypothetical protein